MGLSPISRQNSMPSHLGFPECKQLLSDTKQLLEQNRTELKLSIQLYIPSFKYNQNSWRMSKIICDIHNLNVAEGQQSDIQQIALDMQQIYRIHSLLKHFRKKQLKEAESEERVTVGGEQQQQSDKECCICFDSKASTVLPCGHAYCPLCTSKYIIEQQQHKCPQCRRSFHGNRNTIKKSFFQVIEQDKLLYEQARAQIIQMVAKYNVNAVRALKGEEGIFHKN